MRMPRLDKKNSKWAIKKKRRRMKKSWVLISKQRTIHIPNRSNQSRLLVRKLQMGAVVRTTDLASFD